MSDTAVLVLQVILGVAALAATWRVVRGPGLIDRIIGIDLVLLLLASGLGVQAAQGGSELFVPLVVVITLLAFVGTVLVARFMEWRDTP